MLCKLKTKQLNNILSDRDRERDTDAKPNYHIYTHVRINLLFPSVI